MIFFFQDLVDNHMTPSNARIDIISSSFGRAADFEDDVNSNGGNNQNQPQGEDQDEVAINFSPAKGGRPLVEPIFGTQYWSHRVPLKMIEKWSAAAEPQLPPPESTISLPPVNPFIPKKFALKALPPDDGHHPLLFCSLKLCITVGKKKVSYFSVECPLCCSFLYYFCQKIQTYHLFVAKSTLKGMVSLHSKQVRWNKEQSTISL
jgi:hypothetical protein